MVPVPAETTNFSLYMPGAEVESLAPFVVDPAGRGIVPAPNTREVSSTQSSSLDNVGLGTTAICNDIDEQMIPVVLYVKPPSEDGPKVNGVV